MNATDPIRRVSVVSAGQVQIHPDHEAATWRPVAMWLLTSRRWTGSDTRRATSPRRSSPHLLQAGHVPGVGNRRRLRTATAMVNQLRQHLPGLAILPAHDPGAVIRLAEATGPAPAPAAV
jgi:hypothetical protein